MAISENMVVPLVWLTERATTALRHAFILTQKTADHSRGYFRGIDRVNQFARIKRTGIHLRAVLRWPSPGLLQENGPTAPCTLCNGFCSRSMVKYLLSFSRGWDWVCTNNSKSLETLRRICDTGSLRRGDLCSTSSALRLSHTISPLMLRHSLSGHFVLD